MRYEAKHQHFKCLANSIGNFINICYTLAIRHQCYQCYYLTDNNAFQTQIQIGPEGKDKTKNLLEYVIIMHLYTTGNKDDLLEFTELIQTIAQRNIFWYKFAIYHCIV